MKLIQKITLVFFLFFSSVYADDSVYYEKLLNVWPDIFPDGNRNAAGSKFFSYFLNSDLIFNDFQAYNRLYCPVSGSTVQPNRTPFPIYLSDFNTDEKICGDFYACCWPCTCDVMAYSKVHKINYNFQDGPSELHVITIDNPCDNSAFPLEVNRDYFCKGDQINLDTSFTIAGRLVIGMLHNASQCNQENITEIDEDIITGKECNIRNNTDLDKLNSGMGDIFIKMAQ